VPHTTDGRELPLSGYAHLATNDMHTQELMKRCWLGAPPGQGLTRRPVGIYHGTHPLVATQRVRTTRKTISLSARPQPEGQPKDRAEPADRAQARQPAPDQSGHPYRQPCQ
jgi:hypothetical protein